MKLEKYSPSAIAGVLCFIAIVSFILRVVYKVTSGCGLEYYYTGYGVKFNYIGALIVSLLIAATLVSTIVIQLCAVLFRFWFSDVEGDTMVKKGRKIEDVTKGMGGWSFMRKTTLVISVGILCILALGTLLWGLPRYKVYRLELEGKAKLKEAEWTKKIRIESAKAEKEAARLKAEAEVERAKGVAKANQIIGESLKNNEAYLRYLWIQGLQDGSSEVIYIPTEAGLPLLEAGKRKRAAKPRVPANN